MGLALLAIALVLTLSGSPLVVTHTNATPASEPILEAGSGSKACQSGEVLPAGTTAIRLTLVAAVGPRVSLSVLSGTRVLTSGVTASGWTSGAATVPVKALPRAVAPARSALGLGPSAETVQLGGSRTNATTAARGSLGGATARSTSRSNICAVATARGGRWPRRRQGTWASAVRRAGTWVALLCCC